MSNGLDLGSLSRKMLYGAAAGGTAGVGANWYSSKDLTDIQNPAIGAGIGAGVGAVFDLIRQNQAAKEDAEPTFDEIPEGLYYTEGGLYGNVKGFKGTPVNKWGRHGFLAGIFNQAPTGMESMRLPNGQYAVTFSGMPTLSMGLPTGGFYATLNGKSGDKGEISNIDYRILSSLVNQKAKQEGNYLPKLYPIDLNTQTAMEKVNKMRDIIKTRLGKDLGEYRILGEKSHRNNCLSLSGYLMHRRRLPKQLGYFGSVDTADLDNYEYNY